MKKKLLTLLLSIAVILTSTVTVFATDYVYSGDIFNTVNDVNKWFNGHGIAFGYVYNDELLNREVQKVNDEIYKFSYDDVDYTLTIMNDKLFSIEVSNCEINPYNGTYKLTIASILPSNFPASDEDNSWCKSNNDRVYIYKTDSDLVFYDNTEDCYSVPLFSPLTKEENPEVSYVYSKDETEIQFNMTGDNNDELKNIVVNKCTIPTCIGTYAAPETFSVTYNANGATSGSAPADQTKTSGVGLTLATNTGNLAKTDYTFNGWNTKADGEGTHYDAGATYTTDAALTLYAEWTGASATKTIADILALSKKPFPTEAASGWTNGSQYLYADNEKLYHSKNYPSGLNLSVTVDYDNGNYKLTTQSPNMTNILFSIVDDKLDSITIEGDQDYAGTYVAPVTIADILPEDFPTKKAAGWIKEDGSSDNRIYVDGENLMIGTSPFALNSVVIKDDDNYKYTKSILPITFVMDSNGLEKINFLTMSAPPSGDYVPYKYEKEQTESKPQGYTGDLVFKTNGKYTDPSQVVVKVDGTKLNQNTDYKVDQGSIIVTLLGNYIKNLAPKTYAISIGVKDGETELYSEITSEFTITAAPSPTPDSDTKPRYKIPNTGVEGMLTNNHSLLKLSSLSLLAIGTYLVIKKKKDND